MNTNHRHPRGRTLFPFVVAALLALASHADAAPRFVLKIVDHDGRILMPGAAADPYRDWIEVLAFGTSLRVPESADDATLRAVCQPGGFTFHKGVDQSSPLIQKALLHGLLLPAVQIKYLGNDGSAADGREPIIVELRHVQVIGYRMHGVVSDAAGDPIPTEEVTLAYSESQYLYRQRSDRGDVIDQTQTILTYFRATEDPAFDDDRDGIANDLDQDDDNDGIADRDEEAGGSNPFLDDADEDLDGDRQSNRDEAIAGTRMNDASDYFGIESIVTRHTRKGLQVTVALPVLGGRHYRLLASMDPRVPKEDWVVLDEFDVPEGSRETAADIELSPGLLRNASQLYFRAEVSLMSIPLRPLPGPDPILPPAL